MIRNRPFIYLAITAAALAVLKRHESIATAVVPAGLVAGLPSTSILIMATVALAAIALMPFALFASQETSGFTSRRQFVKESPATLTRRIAEMAAPSRPDVPLMVDYIIFQAIEAGASDIHLDPDRDGFNVKFRVDGMMTDITSVPGKLKGAIANRLKVLSNLVVYQGYLPQDGRLGASENGAAAAEFRIAFMPTLHGERIVIRILGRSAGIKTFGDLGMSDAQQEIMTRLIAEPQGMIILTGPTGSGKTTTIYAALRAVLNNRSAPRAIATLEDPVECEIPGINQSQVNEKKAFTFDKGLRALLRQDPDVIMVGEIRDKETARIAIQAGMTGHLIISTVHANSSSATFSRLVEMGTEPHAINTAVTAVIAQRLLRRLCVSCKRDRPMTPDERESLGLDAAAGFTVFDADGCSACNGTGFKGRYALFEILEVTEPIRALIAQRAATDAIYAEARKQGMRTLFEQGIAALELGETSPAEMRRVVVDARR